MPDPRTVLTTSRLKRAVVAFELIVGSFIIATSFGLLTELYLSGASGNGDDFLQSDLQIVIGLWFVGGAILFDVYRRGPKWWGGD